MNRPTKIEILYVNFEKIHLHAHSELFENKSDKIGGDS